MLSPLLFILYTVYNDCQSDNIHTKILTYADDTVVLVLIKQGDERDYRNYVDTFVKWCHDSCLKVNESRTKEMVFELQEKAWCRSNSNWELSIFRNHSWWDFDMGGNVQSMLSKGHTRLYYTWGRLKNFRVDLTIMRFFYASVVESAMLYGWLSWYNSLIKGDKVKLQRLLNQIGRVMHGESHQPWWNVLAGLVWVWDKVESLLGVAHHPLGQNYRLLATIRQATAAISEMQNKSFFEFLCVVFNSALEQCIINTHSYKSVYLWYTP